MPVTQAGDPECAFPPHPGPGLPGAGPAGASAWSRLTRWARHAPAERLPVPLAVLAWPAAWAAHAGHAPGHDVAYATAAAAVVVLLAWRRHEKAAARAAIGGIPAPHPRLAATEAAAVALTAGAWLTAAITWGPTAGPGHALTLTWAAGTLAGYWWLRRHGAVRAARARRDEQARWTARKAWWHSISHRAGLGPFHLQEETGTHLGYDLLLTGGLDAGELALRVVASPQGYAVRLLQLLGLPYGRADFTLTRTPGQLLVSIREREPTADGPVTHPALDPESPYAGWFPAVPSIRDPVPIGVVPETGDPMQIVLWDREGGKVVGVYGDTGAGKTTLIDGLRERITAMPDAVLIQVNGAKVGDEQAWEPLAAATAAGSARFDEDAAARIMATLEWGQQLVTDRSATHIITGDSVFQPTPEDPAVGFIIDEVDEVAKIPGATAVLEFLASKQRSEGVFLVVSAQRPLQKWTGGGGVKANLSVAVTGRMGLEGDMRHVPGAEMGIPDIAEYSGGAAGFFQVWDPRARRVRSRGRVFDIGSIGQQQSAIISRRDPASRPSLPGPPIAYDHGEEEAEEVRAQDGPVEGLRARLAAVRAANDTPAAPPAAAAAAAPAEAPAAAQLPASIPRQAGLLLLELLAADGGTSSRDAARIISERTATRISYQTAYRWLKLLTDAGRAEVGGTGSTRRFYLTGTVAADAQDAPPILRLIHGEQDPTP